MIVDIINAFNSNYITIQPKHKKESVVEMLGAPPYVAMISTGNKLPWMDLPYLIETIEKHPEFVLEKVIARDENRNKIIYENEKLGKLLNKTQVNELLDTYKKSREIFEQFERDELAYHKGERKTHPHNDKPSWVQRREELFRPISIRNIDALTSNVVDQIIKQHSKEDLIYSKGNGWPPAQFYLNGSILKIAEENGADNCGHGRYSFEEFEVKDIETLNPNGKEIIFPVRKVSLEKIGEKEGSGQYGFYEAFYNKKIVL